MDVIKRAYIKLLNRNCAIYGVDAKDLHDFTTTEKDMNKGQSRFPTPDYQITNEDLLKTSDAEQVQDQMSKASLKDEDGYDA
jgi:indole-3-glycerol phosphate synthase